MMLSLVRSGSIVSPLVQVTGINETSQVCLSRHGCECVNWHFLVLHKCTAMYCVGFLAYHVNPL